MINSAWPRVGAIALGETGDVGAVWMTYDRDTDGVIIYDACLFVNVDLAVIAEGLNARGRFIPVAWAKGAEAFKDEMLNRGVKMLYDPADDGEGMARIITASITERMRSSRLRADARLANWRDQMKAAQRSDGPDAAPQLLVTATRYALQMLPQGKAPESVTARKNLYPNVSIV